MSLTNPDILSKLRNSGFPDATDMPDAVYDEAIGEAERRIKWDYPLETYGLFETVIDQQVYDLFNATPVTATQQGIFANGLRVLEMVGPSAFDWGCTDIFSIYPLLQGINFVPGEFSTFSFNTPSDYWIWDANWAYFTTRFSHREFEHVEARPGSPIRIYPLPKDIHKVFVRYTRRRTDAEVRDENDQAFYLLCKAEAAKIAARKFRPVAGITVGPYRDDGKTSLYWQQEADKLEAQAEDYFESNRFTGMGVVQRT